MNPLINILIRVSRPELFKRCMRSVKEQTYKNVNVIVCHESEMIGNKSEPFYWNLYCNWLKDQVTEGYFFYLDDDDYLAAPNVLEILSDFLKDEPDGVIVQFLRNGIQKPGRAMMANGILKKGCCGGGCLVLHSKHKKLADWKAKEAADFDWISEVAAQVKLKFVPLVVQIAGNGGLKGKQA